MSLEKNAGLEEELDGVREELHKYKATGAVLPEDSLKKVCEETLNNKQLKNKVICIIHFTFMFNKYTIKFPENNS